MDLIYDILKYIYFFFVGAALGSFLDVVVTRTHDEKPWWSGRSECTDCSKKLSWKELIPVFSFLFQKGKCKDCDAKIPFRCLIMEIITGAMTAFLVYQFGFSIEFLIIEMLGLLLLGSFVSDYLYMELFDIFMIPAMILALLHQLIYGIASTRNIIFGVMFGFGFFALQYFATKGRGIGSGDLRLGIIMGLLLAWPLVLFSIMIAYIFGSIISVSLILMKKLNRKSAVPLGVFLIPALAFTFIFSDQILDFVTNYFYALEYVF